MPDSYSSDWKQPFLAALGETDKEKLPALVYAAEQAIFLRMHLRGHFKTGHTGSLQKRPWEGSGT